MERVPAAAAATSLRGTAAGLLEGDTEPQAVGERVTGRPGEPAPACSPHSPGMSADWELVDTESARSEAGSSESPEEPAILEAAA